MVRTKRTTAGEQPAPRRISLRLKLGAVVFVMQALLALFFSIYVPSRMNDTSRVWAGRQAQGIALVLASAARTPYDLADLQGPQQLGKLLLLLEDAPGAVYGSILRDDGSVLTSWNPDGAATIAFRAQQEQGPEVRFREQMLHVRSPIETVSGAKGFLQIGFSLADLEQERRDNSLAIGVIVLAVFVIGLIALNLLLGRILITPIVSLTQVAAEIVSTGRLTSQITFDTRDEIGDLSQSFAKMVEWQRTTLRASGRLTDALGEVTTRISDLGADLAKGSATVQQQVTETTRQMDATLARINKTEADVVDLLRNADDGAKVIHEMADANDSAADDINDMASSVGATLRTVHNMAVSVRNIAGSIDKVNDAVTTTSSSMTELEASVIQVEQNAQSTSALSEVVSGNASRGVGALKQTLDGIEIIEQAFNSAAETIDRLVQRIVEVSTMLRGIDDVTAQTNLLAINAGIISSRAGEHGRGFSVVAEEIRALGGHTKELTQQITDLIQNTREDSEQVISAMEKGNTSVHAGLGLGREAVQALQDIQNSARDEMLMIRQIAQATVEQAANNSSINASLNQIAVTMTHLNQTSTEQASSSAEIIDNTKKLNAIIKQVSETSLAQTSRSKKVIDSIDKINRMVKGVGQGQNEQTERAGKVLTALTAIEQVGQEQSNSVQDLMAVIASLTQHASELQGELGRFKID